MPTSLPLLDPVETRTRFKKAVIVNPPNPPGYVSNKDSMGGFGQLFPAGAPPFPPLDVPYLAAVVGEEGLDVHIIEAGALRMSEPEALSEVLRHAPAPDDLVLVRTSLPTIDADLAFCGALKRRGLTSALLLFGSAVPALLARVQQDASITFAALGEPDQTVVDLMRGVPLDEVSGLLHRVDGAWKRNAERRFNRDLDRLPFPRWDLMPYEKYVIPASAGAKKMRCLPMLSSRGCPFGCNYCPYPVGQGLQWRYRSAPSVVDEMEHLVRDLGIEYILFRDPLFSANKKRVVSICEEIIRRGVQVQWRCETRIDCLDEPTIEIMAKAGCTGVNFGVESSDPQIQKNVERKPITREQFIQTIGYLRKNGITTFAFFIIGLPGDTADTILDTIRFAIELNASWTQFTVATPFIGTKLHDWAVSHDKISADHYHIVSSHEGSMGNENLSAPQIHRLHRFAQIIQRDILNRRGILKNENRRDSLYLAAKRAANGASALLAHGVYAAGSWFFRRTMPRGPATPSSTSVPGRVAQN